MQTFRYFVRNYPGQTTILIGCLALAGVAQVLGISTVIPLIGLASRKAGSASDPTPFELTARSALERIGLHADVTTLLAVIVAAFLVKSGLVLLAKRRVGYTVAATATDLRLQLMRGLLQARWSFYARLPLGGVSNAIATEADRASLAYLYLAQMSAVFVEGCVYFGMALATSVRATLLAAAGGAASMISLAVFVRMASRAGNKQTRLLQVLLGRVNDSFHSIKLFRSMGLEERVCPLLERDTLRLNRALQRRVFSQEALTALQEPILVALMSTYLYTAIMRWQMPIESVLLLVFVLAQVIRCGNKIQRKYQLMVTEERALWAILEFIGSAQAEAEPAGGSVTPTLKSGISFKKVSLGYGGRPVLDHVDVEIPAGAVTALTGPSGSGKTTLLDLVSGLLQPDEGKVFVDGVPLEELDLTAWRQNIGYVSQEAFILHANVRLNVTLGDPSCSDQDVERALRLAHAWDFVKALPDGIDSELGERGALLSGGQRQRIALARALARRPKLVILDEVTAPLDAEGELAIWETVRKLKGETTVLAISHRPALFDIADRIYRIRDARAERWQPGSPAP